VSTCNGCSHLTGINDPKTLPVERREILQGINNRRCGSLIDLEERKNNSAMRERERESEGDDDEGEREEDESEGEEDDGDEREDRAICAVIHSHLDSSRTRDEREI
jgi:hypothetical protein